MKYPFPILLGLLLLLGCKSKKMESLTIPKIKTVQGSSLLGLPLVSPDLDKVKDSLDIQNYLAAEAAYDKNPTADNLIWLGRRMGYLGDYAKAITLFSKGVTDFPEDARFYRHRGHRYITLRQYDYALADFDKGITLIQGSKDEIEPDGIPNKANIPVSTLHTNLYYHKGVAHYLKGEMLAAEKAFADCLAISPNDDSTVASSNWLYMTLMRQGKKDEAETLLPPITTAQTILENFMYHKNLLFYKGELKASKINTPDAPLATKYGLANWAYYHGDLEKAKKGFQEILAKGRWTQIGYMAAEADLSRITKSSLNIPFPKNAKVPALMAQNDKGGRSSR